MKRRKAALNQDRVTVAYVRVSTEDQADKGVSLDAQEARIAAYAVALGLEVSEVIRDAGASAKTLERPGMTRILQGVRVGRVGRVIALKLDRLTRSTRDLAALLDLFAKHDAALVSVSEHLDTQTAAGRMVVSMLGVVAQWEREAIAERTSFALAHKRSAGTAYGPTPFGYERVDGSLLPVATEQAAIAEAIRMDRNGASFREIGAMLTARGVMPKRGRAWYASSVRAMLRSRMVTEHFSLGGL
jgi:site-specific DNA recombinase